MIVEVALFGIVAFFLIAFLPVVVLLLITDASQRATWVGGGRRRPLLVFACAAAAFVVLGVFCARPAPILGLDGAELQTSVGGSALGLAPSACQRHRDREWTCSRYDNQSSGTLPYRVHVGHLGCWTAKRETHYGGEGGSPTDLSGCVNVLDYLFD